MSDGLEHFVKLYLFFFCVKVNLPSEMAKKIHQILSVDIH